jgi:DNA polymerase III subunit delta
MTPERFITTAKSGVIGPIYLVIGTERLLSARVIAALRECVIGGHDLGLNEEHLVAGETTAQQVLAAARTLPMMAPRRLVLVRECDRWEPTGKAKATKGTAPLDVLAAYADDPTPSTVLVLQATKLDARRRLVTAAKKADYLIPCDAPPAGALPAWLAGAAKERGKQLAPGVGQLLVELIGADLTALDDAIERLALYVGNEESISEDAVGECIVQVKPSTVWELVDAVGRRDRGAALRSLSKVYDPQDRGLRLLGVLAWSTRQLVRFDSARRAGLAPAEAAKQAGVPPFKAQSLGAQLQRLTPGELERWLQILARVDLDLKGGSRRPPRPTLEAAIIEMCGRAKSASLPGRKSPHG